MIAIINKKDITISHNSRDAEEYKENGEHHVPIEGHEETQKFLEALEKMGTDAAGSLEELLQAIYELGIKEGKELNDLERNKTQTQSSQIHTLSLGR